MDRSGRNEHGLDGTVPDLVERTRAPPYMLNGPTIFDGWQPVGETMGFGIAARIGAALNDAMHAERVDGFNCWRLPMR